MEPPNSLKGYFIRADPSSPTQRFSCLLKKKTLTPWIPKLRFYIKDDWDLV